MKKYKISILTGTFLFSFIPSQKYNSRLLNIEIDEAQIFILPRMPNFLNSALFFFVVEIGKLKMADLKWQIRIQKS